MGNTIRMHRMRLGLSQRELATLLGYRTPWQVSRHETNRSVPPLMIALGYQEILGVPISELFPGMHITISSAIQQSFRKFQEDLEARVSDGNTAHRDAQKLQWVLQRTTMV
ncbi:MAG TPA: helix-turn-helix domain-containing protein [Bryobacteraceae bacterium]|nr:helix-turn-helix domain-containing protein [Bryobacteraceae bacterium]